MFVASELAQQFNASHEAALRRMVDLSDTACCLVWLSERLKPSQQKNAGPELDLGLPGPASKLRADYQFVSQKWRGFIPPHKSVSDTSVLYSVLSGIDVVDKDEDWSDLKVGKVQIQAVRSIHSEPESRGIMALLRQQ
jgi:hypothetical protein